MAECYSCALDAAAGAGARLHVYLYRGVRNAGELRAGVVAGWRCAAVRARLVLAPQQLAAAANRAALAAARGALVTRSVYSELLYNLSISKKITQSFAQFGIDDADEDVLLCFLTTDSEDPREEVLPRLTGEPRPLSELADLTDMDRLKVAYKLNKLDISSYEDLLDLIISRMATKNFVSH